MGAIHPDRDSFHNGLGLPNGARVPSLKRLLAVIERLFPDLCGEVRRTSYSTDRDIPGTRLRSPGKGREGNELVVYRRDTMTRVFVHNSAETYRTNGEVLGWIRDELGDRILKGAIR